MSVEVDRKVTIYGNLPFGVGGVERNKQFLEAIGYAVMYGAHVGGGPDDEVSISLHHSASEESEDHDWTDAIMVHYKRTGFVMGARWDKSTKSYHFRS